jgi:hypothetical protein
MPNLLRLLSFLLWSVPGLAQAVAIGHGCALDVVDGTLTAIGDHYKATFAAGELEFTPLLGRAAPRNLPFALQVTHAGRSELAAVGPATTHHAELVATFARRELTERLEVRPEGIKQSFVFDQLPPGHGDLVVRCRLRTELRPEATSSDGGLRFLHATAGGVSVGAVLGIDANGHTATGSLRCDGEQLDFVLPAAFVQQARLPLVVDPLLAAVVVTAATLADSTPDVAPLPAPTNAYLVVWQRAVSATDSDVRAQRVSFTGTLLGGLIMLETSNVSTADVSVAASPVANSWLVVCEQAGDIKARFLAATGVLLTATDIANGPNQQRTPMLGGGFFANTSSAMCVWHDATANQILCRRLDLASPGSSFPVVTVAAGSLLSTVGDPAISRDNLRSQALVVWTTTNPLGSRAVRGVVLAPTGVPLSAAVLVAGGGTTEAFAASCAGDGEDFVVAWRTSSTLFGEGAACAPLSYTFGGLGLGPVSVGAARTFTGPNGLVRNTAVAMFQGSAMVAFSSAGTTTNDVVALSVDPLTCSDCEGPLTVDLGGNDSGVSLCSRALGASPNLPNEGAVVFVPIVSGQGDVTLRLLRADDGLRNDLDIACTAGSVSAPCARAGNPNYGLVLREAAANELALVIHSTALLNFQCNPCLIGPDPSLGVVQFLGTTSGTGGIRAALPLPGGPAAVGATIHSQFVLFGGPCFGNFRGTEGISATLQ